MCICRHLEQLTRAHELLSVIWSRLQVVGRRSPQSGSQERRVRRWAVEDGERLINEPCITRHAQIQHSSTSSIAR